MLSCRIFVPKRIRESGKKVPLMVHYHGGGFCTGSAFGPITKMSLSKFVTLAQVVALSVEYRLAPEHPLPIAYDDSWAAFQWVASHAQGNGPEPWLNDFVDFRHVYLGGENAGANIAHNVAIRATENDFDFTFTIAGLLIIHPFFGSKEADRLYQYLYPMSSGMDDEPRLNPSLDPRLCNLACRKVLVCVAGNDKLRDVGIAYYTSLQTSGWPGNLQFLETRDEGHCFHLLNSLSQNTMPFLCHLASFINQDYNIHTNN